MKTALCRLGLPAGIALAVLMLTVAPIDGAAETPDQSSPTNQFLTAYNSMSSAIWLEEKGMRAEAADLYTEALTFFLRISADYPQWQPDLVAFRINYCRTALQRLVGKGKWRAESGTLEATTDDRRQTAEKSGERRAGNEEQTAESRKWKAERGETTDDRKAESGERKSEITNVSPMNARLQQAALKERGRDYTGALAMYNTLLEEYPKEPWALKGACRCCLRLGRMDQAHALVRQALALPLPDAELNLLAALVDCRDGRYQAAIPLLRKSLKQNGACPEAHVALGVALAAGGEMKAAQEEMKRALSFNPKLGDAFYNLARLSLWQKPTNEKTRIPYQMAIDTARVHYQNALRHGSAPDPELDALLAE